MSKKESNPFPTGILRPAAPSGPPSPLIQLTEVIYVVTMYRWGSRENHSYIVGAFSNLELAREAAIAERNNRGGSYEYEIIELRLDDKHITRITALSTMFD